MRIGFVELVLLLFIASITVGPNVALFADRWLRRAQRTSAAAARRKAQLEAQAAIEREALMTRFRVASNIFALLMLAALLHDVIEDHGDRYSFDDLVRAGFPDSVIHALRLLTHESGVLYMDYVKALAKDPIARKVKLADLRHNSDPRRLNGVRAGKYELYQQAIRYLDAENRRTPE